MYIFIFYVSIMEIGNKGIKNREELLKRDSTDNNNFFKKWERVSKNKKAYLLSLFEEGYKSMQTVTNYENPFKNSFDFKVIGPFQKKTNKNYIQSTIYKSLMSLYSKYHHLRNEYGEELLNPLKKTQKIEKPTREIRETTKGILEGNLLIKKPNSQERKLQQGAREKIKEYLEQIKENERKIGEYEAAIQDLEIPECGEFEEQIEKLKEEIEKFEKQIERLTLQYDL